jgi:endoglucanase Acf2
VTGRRRLILLAAVVLVVLAAVAVWAYRARTAPAALDISAVSKLPQHASTVTPLRLADGLTPPTNRWFSGLVFGKTPQPVYAYPLSFKPTASGFELDAPQVSGSTNAVFAAHRPTIRVDLGARDSQVAAYDDLSVVVAHQSAGRTVASTQLVQGSPFAYVTLPDGGTVRLTTAGRVTDLHDGRLIIIGGQTFGLVTTGSVAVADGNLTIDVPAGGRLALFALPGDADTAAYYRAAHHPVTATSVSYRQSGDRLLTTYRLETSGGSTLFAANPNLPLDRPQAVKGEFNTLLGRQPVASGIEFTASLPLTTPPAELDLSRLTPADRTAILKQLRSDAAAVTFPAHDTYFAGKELYRAANLLQLAHQLGAADIAGDLQAKLKAELMTWYDPAGESKRPHKFFYYDATTKGIVGTTPAFGSEQFNDHHFHYGYFIYASAVLARYDKDFYTSARPFVNLLIADIASPAATERFPRLRVFDSYAGHSWASGYADFADGNNQESSSEAVTAWYALYLWGRVAGDQALSDHGRWLYQLESASATSLWLRHDGTPVAPDYAHPFVSLVWGGKLDYATFFSPRPQALLGIQLIPMSPGHSYLAHESAVSRNLDQISADGQFADYIIMYQALSDAASARTNLASFSPADLDSANSLSYLQAWVYSR